MSLDNTTTITPYVSITTTPTTTAPSSNDSFNLEDYEEVNQTIEYSTLAQNLIQDLLTPMITDENSNLL
jgi:hypothetical protein